MTLPKSRSNVRFLMHHEEEMLPKRRKEKQLNGLYLITEDGLGVSDALADLLIYRGAFSYVIEASKCTNQADIEQEIKKARDIFGQVNGIIHLAGLKSMDFPSKLDAWKKEVQIQCKSFFHILRTSYEDIEGDKTRSFRRLITCSLLGGYYGRDLSEQAGLPIAGSGQGLLKSLEYEWDSIIAKAIDFDLSLQPKTMAKLILNELSYGNGNSEIGYPLGKRIVFSTHSAPLQKSINPIGFCPTEELVILATGGARGITAETIKLLSNENNRMILLGRSALLDNSHFIKYKRLDEAQLRKAFIEESIQENVKASPSMIEAKIRRTLADREIRNNLASLRHLGNRVEYVSCDVADEDVFSALIASIYQTYGKIDVVVHGAGVIQDYLLRDKESSSLDKVFDTKVNSAFILKSHLKLKQLKALVFFSSTAGRYGNKGQSDYAAANEVLNRMAWRIKSEHPHITVKSLNWGPWSGVGMASEVVNDQFINRGIIPIDVESGTGYFLGELMHGEGKEVEIVLGEGTWNPNREDLLKELFNIKISFIDSNSKSNN